MAAIMGRTNSRGKTGRAGIALVRGGKVIDTLITALN
jgi:hypothetical protein